MSNLGDIFSPSTWPLRLEHLSIPVALLLFACLASFVLITGLPTLKWLGPTRRAIAIGVRLAVVWVLVMTLGGLKWWREHADVETIVLRDVSASMANVRSETSVADQTDRMIARAMQGRAHQANDRIGVIRIGERSVIERVPSVEWSPSGATITTRTGRRRRAGREIPAGGPVPTSG